MQCSPQVAPECNDRPPDAAQLVADVSALITPPMVCVKMFELVRSANSSSRDIGDVVALDPNLAARLLRIVNSSFYGFTADIRTISRAVTILGTRDLYNLVLAITSVRSFSKMSAGLVQMETFWQHSVYCALLARELAKHFRVPDPERLFVAGLLHEVGICVIYSRLPQYELQMREALEEGEIALHDAELRQFGYSHATIGALVLEQWQLPLEIRNAVRYHHDPVSAPTGRVESAVVHLADAFANVAQTGTLSPTSAEALQVDKSVWDILGQNPESLDHTVIIEAANAAYAEAMQNLMPRRGK